MLFGANKTQQHRPSEGAINHITKEEDVGVGQEYSLESSDILSKRPWCVYVHGNKHTPAQVYVHHNMYVGCCASMVGYNYCYKELQLFDIVSRARSLSLRKTSGCWSHLRLF